MHSALAERIPEDSAGPFRQIETYLVSVEAFVAHKPMPVTYAARQFAENISVAKSTEYSNLLGALALLFVALIVVGLLSTALALVVGSATAALASSILMPIGFAALSAVLYKADGIPSD